MAIFTSRWPAAPVPPLRCLFRCFHLYIVDLDFHTQCSFFLLRYSSVNLYVYTVQTALRVV